MVIKVTFTHYNDEKVRCFTSFKGAIRFILEQFETYCRCISYKEIAILDAEIAELVANYKNLTEEGWRDKLMKDGELNVVVPNFYKLEQIYLTPNQEAVFTALSECRHNRYGGWMSNLGIREAANISMANTVTGSCLALQRLGLVESTIQTLLDGSAQHKFYRAVV